MTLMCDLDLSVFLYFEPVFCDSVPAGQNISKFLLSVA